MKKLLIVVALLFATQAFADDLEEYVRLLKTDLQAQSRDIISKGMQTFTAEEAKRLIFQFGISKGRGGRRHLPHAFTEQGVAMLSTVLNSEAAIQVSIQIIRVFTRMREFLSENKDVFLKMENYEKKFLKHDKKLSKHEKEIQIIFDALKRLINPRIPPRKRIGYRMTKDND